MTRRAGDFTASHWSPLQAAIAGEVILPESRDYDSARKPAIGRFDHVHPAAIVRCQTAGDVAETISFAHAVGLPTATRSGGHCFAGRSSSEGIVIDVTPMDAVSVSGAVATVGAGARLGEVYDSLSEHDRTLPAGSCPSVGIAGLTLGGGLGILGRKYGLTCDQLLAANVVLADARVVDCDGDHDPELFWALRGAGSGNFGVVTLLVFRTLPASSATNFHLAWPYARAAAVIDAWQALAPTAPDELYASLLLTAGGEVEEQPRLDLFGSLLGSEREAADLLSAFAIRAGVDPTTDFRKHMSPQETTVYWAALGAANGADRDEQQLMSQHEYPMFKSEFFSRPLPAEAVAALLARLAQERVPGQSRELDFTPWGGAYNRHREDATAFVHRRELFSLKHTALVDSDSPKAAKDEAQRWLTKSWMTVRPWGTGRVFPNFPDSDLRDWRRAYYGRNYERLVRVKGTYDPRNFFRFHQSLPSNPHNE
ncbi:MAG TPA: FAD-binding oxidoreductase [Gaiellaceae bacterium]|nr:FAD-binding oxidoreductase [Gaiellaceae bacterium]